MHVSDDVSNALKHVVYTTVSAVADSINYRIVLQTCCAIRMRAQFGLQVQIGQELNKLGQDLRGGLFIKREGTEVRLPYPTVPMIRTRDGVSFWTHFAIGVALIGSNICNAQLRKYPVSYLCCTMVVVSTY